MGMQARWLDRPAPYLPVWQAMRDFTESRADDTPDALWLVEHAPVYTLGQAGKPEHILNPHGIPVVHCNRGGQVTYHGPGQVVLYTLVDLRRRGIFVREFVTLLEQAVLDLLAERVRTKLGKTAAELPLACILEGGTWAAGREIAAELREGGAPPLKIDSDGTVF